MFKNSISEFYSEEFSTIGEHDLLGNCIQSLKKGKPASMLVLDNAGRYVGVIGQRQLRGQHLDASKTKIASVMQPAPRIDISDTLTRAATLMIRTDIRTLPVLENKKLIGIITADDVIDGAVLDDWGEEKLEAIQSTNLITFSPEDNIGSVRATFRKNKISHAPVVKNQELDGIISASDVLDFSTSPRFRATRGERKGERINMADIPIKRVYVTSVITGRKNESIRDAVQKMKINDIESLIIVDRKNKPIGIVTKQDFLEPIAQMKVEEHPIIMKLIEKNINISDINRTKMYDRFARFIRPYEEFLVHGEMKVILKKIGTDEKGDHHIQCNINFWTKVGDMNCKVEGYGVFDMFQEALSKMERIVKEKIGTIRNY